MSASLSRSHHVRGHKPVAVVSHQGDNGPIAFNDSERLLRLILRKAIRNWGGMTRDEELGIEDDVIRLVRSHARTTAKAKRVLS